MHEKWTLAIIIVLTALFVLIVAYIDNENTIETENTMTFNVSSGYSKLSEVIENIKTKPYYEGYDAETVKWMESLENKLVFYGNDNMVIMNSADAEKIPNEYDVTDVYIYYHFSAEVVEKHSLGSNNSTVYYVKNVKFINQELVDSGLA